jgi:hypothetical protein
VSVLNKSRPIRWASMARCPVLQPVLQLVAAVLVQAGCLGATSTTILAADATTYETDFREAKFDNQFLVPTSPGNASLTRPDKDGIHLSSSPGKVVTNLGFGPRFKVKGDFEITAAFTVIRAPQPKDGFGSGAVLQIGTNSPDRPSAVMGRLSRKDGKQIFSTYAAVGTGDQRKSSVRMFPTEATECRIRVARTGSTLQFSIMDNPGGTFRKLSSAPFDANDVNLLRFGLQQSDAESDVEVVWHDLKIQAAELPGLPGTLAEGEKQHRPKLEYQPPPTPFPWGWASATVGLGVLFVVYWWRQRQS